MVFRVLFVDGLEIFGFLSGVPFSKPKSGGPMILEIPLDKIRRPLMRTRANDPQKVKDLMESISQIGLQEPVSSSLFVKN